MTVSAQPGWIDALIELLTQQRQVYLNLQQLSGQQTQFVQAGEAEQLLTLLSHRQRLIDELTQINLRLEPYRRNWTTLWTQLDGDEQSRVRHLIDQVQHLLDQIVQQDDADRAALTAQRRAVLGELAQTRSATIVHRAYGQEAGPIHKTRYTDTEG